MADYGRESADPLYPGRTFGKGKWPSFQYALHLHELSLIYGRYFPERFHTTITPYGCAFSYADAKWNRGEYGKLQDKSNNIDVIKKYHEAVANGADLLPFTVYVPPGMGILVTDRFPMSRKQPTRKICLPPVLRMAKAGKNCIFQNSTFSWMAGCIVRSK